MATGQMALNRAPTAPARSAPAGFRIQPSLPHEYLKASPEDLARRIATAKSALGDRLMILGHHYQRHEVMAWADARGDSFGLSRRAADSRAEFIVFCGVHFMAESADILTAAHQKVILPDLNAGCSMADMADIDSVEEAWEDLARWADGSTGNRLVPITYMNSSADLKAFVGEKGGAVCTSSNARAVVSWALERGDRLLFFPDQHLGRNTAHQLGFSETDLCVWDPRRALGGLAPDQVSRSTFLLWKGHCSVHQRFTTAQIADFRRDRPGAVVVVHPECSREVVQAADLVGSTDFIISSVRSAGPGSVLGIGTEIHLVARLADDHPDRTVVSLDPVVCPCSTMFRIDSAHLAWVLSNLLEGRVVNQIQVPESTAAWARVALDRMLAIT
ncbi:MAG: quinolinate synthase NadA [Acidimicrobiales bacterium]